MTTFSKAQRDIKPPKILVLPPSAFADEWGDKRSTEVAMGLRLVSQGELETGRKEAEREATGFYAELRGTPIPADPHVATDIFNDAIVMHVVACGTCDPNDVTRPYFRAAPDTVRVALTPDGARRIYDEIMLLHKGMSPGYPQASDAEAAALGRRLAHGETLDAEDRKLCARLIEKLGVTVDERPFPDEDEDDDEGVYIARTG
jgi:hypothetical protein